MSNDDLRALRDQALSGLDGSSLAEQYERGAVMMGWEGLTDEIADADTDQLRVEVRGVDRIGSHHVGRLSTSLQNAVSYIAKFQQNPRISPNAQLTERDRDRFEIIQEAQVGGTLVFRVPAIPMERSGLQVGKHAAASSKAVRELIETLPRADDDHWSMDGILGAPAQIRRAIHGLSSAVAAVPNGVDFLLAPERGEPEVAALSHVRAEELRHDLNQKSERVSTETHVGLLDGLRGTRRVFYLVFADGTEIAGAVDEDMVNEVKRFEHRQVKVRLEAIQWTKANGRLGKKGYRLESITKAPEQGQFEDLSTWD